MTSYTNQLQTHFSASGKKYLNNSQVTKLIYQTEYTVKQLLKDPKMIYDVKSDSKEVLQWIQDLRVTFKEEKKLPPNFVSLMIKNSLGISSCRYGSSKKGFK